MTYLDHSAWLVETKNRLLLFDYGDLPHRPAGGHLENGVLDLLQLPALPLYAFASHRHADHYSAFLHKQLGRREDTCFFLGLDHQPSKAEAKACPPGTWLCWPHSKLLVDDLTLYFTGSTDSGVSVLIDSPEGVFYHGGDLALWDDTAYYRETYRREIDLLGEWLSQIGRAPDLAFLPVSTSDGYQEDALLGGLWYVLDKMHPRVILPMHAHGYEDLYQNFARLAQAFGWTNILVPQKPGDRFTEEPGKS